MLMTRNVFDLLEGELKKAVAERFSKPTPIQEGVIPEILKGHNVLTISETGSGKTEAAMLPVFDMWVREKPEPVSILYITPLRSLNRDLLKRIEWWSERLGFSVGVRHGDTTQSERAKQARKPPDMLISTPETLQAMLTGSQMRKALKGVRYVAIDEVHELVPSKRGLQLTVGLERLREVTGKDFQILCMSATVGTPEEIVKFFSIDRKRHRIVNVSSLKSRKIRVESPRPGKEDSLSSDKLSVSMEVAARLRRIRDLIRERNSVLVFTNTREFSEILSSRLKSLDKGLWIETHHSSLSKEVRTDAEKDFREGRIKALVCTSSLELGIDIGSIDLVIQYMSPRQVSKLLQRIGRSGHSLERVSEGVIIASDPDDCFESAAIASLAEKGWTEPTKPYNGALDVLGHQILGLSLDEYRIPAKKAFSIVKRAHPYRNLSFEEFMEVGRILQKLGLIWTDSKFDKEPALRRRRRTFLHYYGNLSTIPDTKTYRVHDVVSDRPVGTLDAEFIALHGNPGTSFIVKGQAWRILDVRRDKVLVEPLSGIEAAIPAWEGELIPVPFEVAQEVGRMRRRIKGMLAKKKRKDAVRELMKELPVSRDVAEKMVGLVRRQMEWGFVPDDRNVLLEYYSDGDESWVVIHTCWGSLVNDTIGRVLSAVVMRRVGSVGLQTDPCRIMMKLQHMSDWKSVEEAFRNLRAKDIKSVLEDVVPDTELFAWRFIHVAKRFGIISRDAEFGKGYIRKIIEVYRNTPPYREALNEVFQEKLDVEASERIAERLGSGRIRIEARPGISPMGTSGIQKKYEIVAPERPEREIFQTFKKRILDTKVGLVCMQCCDYATISSVRELPEEIGCPLCSARLVAVVPARYLLEAQELARKAKAGKKLSAEERKYHNQMADSASLVMSSGKNAAIALAGRGVGVRTASRILSRLVSGDDIFRLVLEAEKQYAKTKRFWKS